MGRTEDARGGDNTNLADYSAKGPDDREKATEKSAAGMRRLTDGQSILTPQTTRNLMFTTADWTGCGILMSNSRGCNTGAFGIFDGPGRRVLASKSSIGGAGMGESLGQN